MNPKDLIGAKKSPLGVVPPSLVPFVAPAMAVGANKYGPFNWRAQKVQAMTYIEAAQRHLLAWVDGQENAEDTGVHHISHALAGLAILADAISADNLIDNRPAPGPTPGILRAQDKSLALVVDPVTTETWGTGDGPVYGMPRATWNRHGGPEPVIETTESAPGRFEMTGPNTMGPGTEFLCGHSFGEAPNTLCGSNVHWSRVNGIELKRPPIAIGEQECPCQPDWTEHAMDCPLFHVPRT